MFKLLSLGVIACQVALSTCRVVSSPQGGAILARAPDSGTDSPGIHLNGITNITTSLTNDTQGSNRVIEFAVDENYSGYARPYFQKQISYVEITSILEAVEKDIAKNYVGSRDLKYPYSLQDRSPGLDATFVAKPTGESMGRPRLTYQMITDTVIEKGLKPYIKNQFQTEGKINAFHYSIVRQTTNYPLTEGDIFVGADSTVASS